MLLNHDDDAAAEELRTGIRKADLEAFAQNLKEQSGGRELLLTLMDLRDEILVRYTLSKWGFLLQFIRSFHSLIAALSCLISRITNSSR